MDSFTFTRQASMSLREKITNDIRNAILKGELKSGSRFKEIEIARQMGVSRGPVREAIRQLEREGLLVTTPYRETVVADIALEEVKEILIPIRYQLESFVIRHYIEGVEAPFFDGLQEIVDLMAAAYELGQRDRLIELDVRFHEAIVMLAAERTVRMTWNSILNQTRLHFIKNVRYYADDTIVRDHRTLLDKLRAKDPDAIMHELDRHLRGDASFQFD